MIEKLYEENDDSYPPIMTSAGWLAPMPEPSSRACQAASSPVVGAATSSSSPGGAGWERGAHELRLNSPMTPCQAGAGADGGPGHSTRQQRTAAADPLASIVVVAAAAPTIVVAPAAAPLLIPAVPSPVPAVLPVLSDIFEPFPRHHLHPDHRR